MVFGSQVWNFHNGYCFCWLLSLGILATVVRSVISLDCSLLYKGRWIPVGCQPKGEFLSIPPPTVPPYPHLQIDPTGSFPCSTPQSHLSPRATRLLVKPMKSWVPRISGGLMHQSSSWLLVSHLSCSSHSPEPFQAIITSLKPLTHADFLHTLKIISLLISQRPELRTAPSVLYTLICTFSYPFNCLSRSLPCPRCTIWIPVPCSTRTFPGTSSTLSGDKWAKGADGKYLACVNCWVSIRKKRDPQWRSNPLSVFHFRIWYLWYHTSGPLSTIVKILSASKELASSYCEIRFTFHCSVTKR